MELSLLFVLGSATRPASQGEDFLDSYIGFVAAGYSVNVRAVVQCQAIPSLVTDFL